MCLERHLRNKLNKTDCASSTNFKSYIMSGFHVGMYARLQKGCVDKAYWPREVQTRIGDFGTCDCK